MTTLEKIKNLVNPAKWVQGFMLSKFSKRAAQFGAAALVGLISNPKVTELLGKYGASLDVDKDILADSISVAIVALLGGIFNTAKHGPLKTVGDDPNAPAEKP